VHRTLGHWNCLCVWKCQTSKLSLSCQPSTLIEPMYTVQRWCCFGKIIDNCRYCSGSGSVVHRFRRSVASASGSTGQCEQCCMWCSKCYCCGCCQCPCHSCCYCPRSLLLLCPGRSYCHDCLSLIIQLCWWIHIPKCGCGHCCCSEMKLKLTPFLPVLSSQGQGLWGIQMTFLGRPWRSSWSASRTSIWLGANPTSENPHLPRRRKGGDGQALHSLST
jgi:hypothetical protein